MANVSGEVCDFTRDENHHQRAKLRSVHMEGTRTSQAQADLGSSGELMLATSHKELMPKMATGSPGRRLDDRLGAGSRRPTGRRRWGKSCGGHWLELAAVALVLGGSRGGGKGGCEFGSRGVHGCAGAELEEATDWA